MDKVFNFSPNSKRWFSLEDFEGEIWKDIEEFKGCYLISNFGRVKTIKRNVSCCGKNRVKSYVVVKEKIKRYSDNGHGYIVVNLCKNDKNHIRYVHRLVASAFLPNPLNLPQVNHKDENKENNVIGNLEWCTGLYNNNYGTAKIRGKYTYKKNGHNRSVDMYDKQGNFVKHYECAYDMERDGIKRREAYNVCYGRSRSYKNCVFRFSSDNFSYRKTDVYPKGKKKQVIKTDVNGNILKIYISIKEAERENGLNRNYLYSATYASTRKAFINGAYYEIKNTTKSE